jgi:hypothetical protein
VIESELAITKAPTKSAIPANESRNVCRKLMKLFVSSASLVAWLLPLLTWVPGGDLSGKLRRRDAGLRLDANLVELPGLPEQILRGREVEPCERRPADRRHRAELDEARDAELLDRPFRLDAELLADCKVFLAGGGLVDDDLAGARPPTADERK